MKTDNIIKTQAARYRRFESRLADSLMDSYARAMERLAYWQMLERKFGKSTTRGIWFEVYGFNRED